MCAGACSSCFAFNGRCYNIRTLRNIAISFVFVIVKQLNQTYDVTSTLFTLV